MQAKTKSFFRTIRQDKVLFVLLVTLIFAGVWMVFDVLLNTKASQVQIWYRFVAFGAENYSRAVWMYAYNWAGLAVMIVSLHIAVAAKLLKSNYREVAALVLGIGIVLIISANVSFNLILGLPR